MTMIMIDDDSRLRFILYIPEGLPLIGVFMDFLA